MEKGAHTRDRYYEEIYSYTNDADDHADDAAVKVARDGDDANVATVDDRGANAVANVVMLVKLTRAMHTISNDGCGSGLMGIINDHDDDPVDLRKCRLLFARWCYRCSCRSLYGFGVTRCVPPCSQQ